jgi:hypothetical protein
MLMSADMPGPTPLSFPMRRLLFAGGAVLLSVSHGFGSTDFSGTSVLDLRASSSPDRILKRLGASWIERQLGSSLQLESTYIQTPHLLTVHIRGPAFRRTDLIRVSIINLRRKRNPAPDDIRFALGGPAMGRNSFLLFLFALRIRAMPN